MNDENKFKSRKFIMTIWAPVIFSILAIGSLINKNQPEWTGVCMPILGSIVLTYIGGQSWIDGKK